MRPCTTFAGGINPFTGLPPVVDGPTKPIDPIALYLKVHGECSAQKVAKGLGLRPNRVSVKLLRLSTEHLHVSRRASEIPAKNGTPTWLYKFIDQE